MGRTEVRYSTAQWDTKHGSSRKARYASLRGALRFALQRVALLRFAPLRFRFRRGTGHHPLVDESLEKIKGGAEAREHVDGETVTNKLCCSFMW